uniref:Mitochondrial carrier protein n=2 Tax=Eukaryota TaxID=2759 RepID=A0A7S3E3X6_9CHLO|mmetsp:Transcript_5908/g.15297  ORF Transcript_5908/g.15297 Transcript_5908/m.15297 type:complete len:414 (+) Transcript_5908:1355-2596(+)
MTEATLSFRCVKASKELGVCDLSDLRTNPGRKLSLRGGFEMYAVKPAAQAKTQAGGSGLFHRVKSLGGLRKRSVTARRATLSATLPLEEGQKALSVLEDLQAPAESLATSKKVAVVGEDEKKKSKAKPLADTIAGALARAASQSTIHPLDTMKVQMQAGTFGSAGLSKIGSLVPPTGIGGVASLYRGVVGAASGAGIAIGAYFAIYSSTTKLLDLHVKPRFKNIPPGAIAFTAGAIAAAGGSFVKVPLAVCIRSVQAGVYKNVAVAAKSITSRAGARGLFTGFLPTLLEDVPDMAVKFACYESLKQFHSKVTKRRTNTEEDFMIGMFSGAVSAGATTPLDCIKTRMMCSAASSPSLQVACRSIWADGGARAFFTGMGPRAVSNGINTAVFFAFYEAIQKMMNKQNKQLEAASS